MSTLTVACQPPEEQEVADVDRQMDAGEDVDMNVEDFAMEQDLRPDPSVCTAELCVEGQIDHIPPFLRLSLGKSFTFEPVVIDAQGNVVEGVEFTYSSSVRSIAEIDEQGVLTPQEGSRGRLDVTIKAAGLEQVIPIEYSFFSISYSTLVRVTGKVGEQAQLFLRTADLDFNTVDLPAIFTSQDESIATVEESTGLVTFVGVGETSVLIEERFGSSSSSTEVIVTEDE